MSYSDFLFHLAAQPLVGLSYSDPVNTFMTNTMGTVNILDSLKTSANSVHVSSLLVTNVMTMLSGLGAIERLTR